MADSLNIEWFCEINKEQKYKRIKIEQNIDLHYENCKRRCYNRVLGTRLYE